MGPGARRAAASRSRRSGAARARPAEHRATGAEITSAPKNQVLMAKPIRPLAAQATCDAEAHTVATAPRAT
jgi:hypothetical protein